MADEPATPETGAGAPATGEQSPQQPSTPEPSTGRQPATGEDGTDWKKHARTWESRSKANEAKLGEYEQKIAALTKALGIEGEDDLPEHAKAKLTEAEQRAADAEQRAVELAYENAVSRVAATVGADAEALLDSGSFRDAVADELGDDFDDTDLRKAVEKVAKEFAKKPRFANTPTAPPRSGGEMTGAPPPARQRPKSLTEALGRALGGGGN